MAHSEDLHVMRVSGHTGKRKVAMRPLRLDGDLLEHLQRSFDVSREGKGKRRLGGGERVRARRLNERGSRRRLQEQSLLPSGRQTPDQYSLADNRLAGG